MDETIQRNGLVRGTISILGSTGSIGVQTLQVVAAMGDRFRVVGLAAGKNVSLLAEQVRTFQPRIVSVADRESAMLLRSQIDSAVRVVWGEEGLVETALYDDVDCVVTAVVGALGVKPTLAALEHGKRVALANKESLVAAGALAVAAAQKSGAEIIPVDSEHSAIFQCLRGEERREVHRLILTASGGPFRSASAREIAQATPADALKHPTWRMGGKITIDSATLMNKGLEVIEAHWLFGAEYDAIDVLIHPQSVVHSMVEFTDGSVIAQLGTADMRTPIQYALCYPERVKTPWERLRLTEAALTFEEPDVGRFPALSLAYAAGRAGGTAPAVLNAANEVAVHAFLREEIRFPGIVECVERVLSEHNVVAADSLDTVLHVDAWARERATAIVRQQREELCSS